MVVRVEAKSEPKRHLIAPSGGHVEAGHDPLCSFPSSCSSIGGLSKRNPEPITTEHSGFHQHSDVHHPLQPRRFSRLRGYGRRQGDALGQLPEQQQRGSQRIVHLLVR